MAAIRELRILILPNDPLERYEEGGYDGWFPEYFNPSGLFEHVYVAQVGRKAEKRSTHGMTVWTAGGSGVYAYVRLLYLVLRLIRKQRIDIIRTYNPQFHGIIAIVASFWRRIPSVISLHADYETCRRLNGMSRFRRLMMRVSERLCLRLASLQRASEIWCVSPFVVDYAKQMGAVAHKLRVMPNRVRLERFADSNQQERQMVEKEPFRAIYVGRLSPEKNLHSLIEAFDILCANLGGEGKLFMIGGGPLRRELEEECGRRGLERNVEFTGVVPNSRLIAYYQRSDCFVLPSSSEGFGTVLLEAQAAGKAIIANNIAGVKLPLEGAGAILVDARNPTLLAGALIRLAEDRGLCRQLGAQSKENAKKFSWERIAQLEKRRYLSILNTVATD